MLTFTPLAPVMYAWTELTKTFDLIRVIKGDKLNLPRTRAETHKSWCTPNSTRQIDED